MIQTELINENLVRTYSDRYVYIHGGEPEGDYAEAVDPVEAGRTYVETDTPIETSDDEKIYIDRKIAELQALILEH